MRVLLLSICLLLLQAAAMAQQARLDIKNNSDRFMEIKVMQYSYTGELLYSKVSVAARQNESVYFPQTGNYFLKSKAIYQGKNPIYKKGNEFNVYVGDDGYSVLTITYSITESNSFNPTEGKQISASEYEKN